ncbi:MAG: type II secretion system protein GspJ [Pseudomonadota bacterium]
MTRRPGDSGFTLIELLISLGLFALIAVAGLALVQGILNVQGRTEKRLDRLAELQRTMFVVTSDLDQIAHGRVSGDAGEGLTFTRSAAGIGGPPVEVHYRVLGGMLSRQAGAMPQQLLTGVSGAEWRFFDGSWTAKWPRNDEEADRWPRAVEIRLQVATPGGGPTGTLRRVVTLPAQAEEPPVAAIPRVWNAM